MSLIVSRDLPAKLRVRYAGLVGHKVVEKSAAKPIKLALEWEVSFVGKTTFSRDSFAFSLLSNRIKLRDQSAQLLTGGTDWNKIVRHLRYLPQAHPW
jgi:hypothetical protein